MLGVNIACPLKNITTKRFLAYFSMFSFSDKKNSNCKLTIMDQQFKNYIGYTAWLGIIIVKTRLTMSNWSSEAVNQRRDNIITKGKNDKTIKWSTTDYRNTFCIRLFFSFFFFFYIYIYIYVLIKYISIRIVWNKYLEYMNIGLVNMILSKWI
jgi:hypothetical protein